jgi:hypothetical protein
MKHIRTTACATLSVVAMLSGCHKKAPVAAAPPLPPPEMSSVPPLSHHTDPDPDIPLEEAEALTVLLPRHTVFRYRPVPLQQIIIAPAPPPPIELGQLTAGDTAPRQETEDLLRSQQRRLSAISPAIAALHSQQVEQARLFLKQADDAWQKSDVDGARTLATKAKVLLDEVLT